jgi:hypothetical protein
LSETTRKGKYLAPYSESAYGGYRLGGDGKDYWLRKELVVEYDRMADEPDDGVWVAWWDAFSKKHHLIPSPSYKMDDYADFRSGYEASDWKSKLSETSKSKGSYLGSWWQGDYGKGWSSFGKDNMRLALALRAVQATMRIIDDHIPPLTVGWASNYISSSDLQNNRIIINPRPILEVASKKLDEGEAIDIATAFMMHEASHSKHTRAVAPSLYKPNKLEPPAIAAYLANILEDVRIERLTSEEFPGFAGYFLKGRSYLWDSDCKDHLPAAYGVGATPKEALGSALNAAVSIVKWPEHNDLLVDPSFAPEIEWWTKWSDDYQRDTVNLRESVIRGLDHIRHLLPPADGEGEGEGEEMGAWGSCLKTPSGDPEQDAKSLAEQLGLISSCMSEVSDPSENGNFIDSSSADSIEKLVEDELRDVKIRIPDQTGRRPSIHVRHPRFDGKRGVNKLKGMAARLRAALQFRPELPHYSERILKSGTIDEAEIWRFGADDYRIFERQVIETYPNVHVGLLVDISGSMSGVANRNDWGAGSKLRVAEDLAALFIEALRTMEGVTPRVWAHTGDTDLGGASEVFEIWQPGESLDRLKLITSIQHGNNYDGYAIGYVVDQLLAVGQSADNRLLIVLSDGYPAGSGYGGYTAENHVRTVTDDAEKRGVYVIQIAIDADLRAESQNRMFSHWVEYEPNDLPRRFARILSATVNRA